MADEEENPADVGKTMGDKVENSTDNDVFVNGGDLCASSDPKACVPATAEASLCRSNSENGKCNSENSDTTTTAAASATSNNDNSVNVRDAEDTDNTRVLPRRSSLMKRNRDTNDGSRREQRKKTVSFSSMPTEKPKIATGK